MSARSHSRAAGGLHKHANRKALAGIVVSLLLLIALAAAWRWTPLNEWLDADTLIASADRLKEGPYTPFIVAATYVVAGLVMFPVTLLNTVIVIVFGPLMGIVYALSGAALSAAVTYGIGRRLGRKTVRRVAGARLNRLSDRLARRGVLSMTLVRLVPIAPYTIVNLAAGASQIGFRDFLLGTVFGLSPGIVATALFVDRAAAAITDPGITTIGLLVVVAVAIVVVAIVLRRRLTE